MQGSLQDLFCPLALLCNVPFDRIETSLRSKVQLVSLSIALRKKLGLAECRTRAAFLPVADSFRIQKESFQSSQERTVYFFVLLSLQLLYWMRVSHMHLFTHKGSLQ